MTQRSVSVGKYSLVELLGEDALCSRWRATSSDSASDVLVTLMAPALLGGPEGIARFRSEARRAVDLNSPFVALVLDEGVAEETGAPYVVTELLRGQSLAERLSRIRLRARDVARYVMQVGEALSEASEKGLLHRDLRPENISLVGEPDEEMVKVQDFGVSSGIWAASAKVDQTYGDGWPRAASYMSPEQRRTPKGADYRSDLWSLAVVTFECLTGRHPFEGDDGSRRAALHLQRAPRPVPSRIGVVPVGFDEWFARATARDIRERFQSAAELTSSLHALCCKPEPAEGARSVRVLTLPPGAEAAPVAAGLPDARAAAGAPPHVAPTLLATLRHEQLRLPLLAGLVLGISLVALALLWSRHRERSPEPQAAPVEALGSAAPAEARSSASAPP